MVCPNKFPHSFIAPLVSIVLFNSEPIDNLTWSALATLAEVGMRLHTQTHSFIECFFYCFLALCNAKLASECSVVKALVCGLLKCQVCLPPSFSTPSSPLSLPHPSLFPPILSLLSSYSLPSPLYFPLFLYPFSPLSLPFWFFLPLSPSFFISYFMFFFSQFPAINETVVLTLTQLLNHPETRKFVRAHLDIEVQYRPLIYLSVNSSIHPSIHSSIHPFINPSIHPSIHPFIHPTILLFLS